MCGIAGLFGEVGEQDEPKVAAALAAMRSRGPDHRAVFAAQNAVFGYNRLAIRGLGSDGEQPLFDHRSGVILFGVGEVYNYAELRQVLEQAGCVFRSSSDLEVFIHLYLLHGAREFSQVNGDFTVALFDQRNRKGIIARDPLGVKPLFVALREGRLAFASEAKGLKALLDRAMLPSFRAIAEYLIFNYPLGTGTYYEDVQMLPPGSVASFQNGVLDIERIHELSETDLQAVPSQASVFSLLEESVNLRLVSDVSLGMHISGGVDSSLVAHFAAAAHAHCLHGFTAAYDRSSEDAVFGKAVAASLGLVHQHIPLEVKTIANQIDTLIACLDGPVMSMGAFTPYAIARAAHAKDVKVLLAGQGADEIFCGYSRFGKAIADAEFSHDSIFAACANVSMNTLREFVPDQDTHLAAELEAVHADVNQSFREADPINAMQLFYMRSFLQELLRIEDHVHMAFSVENRVPFLDLDVVRYGFQQAPRSKGKQPLRNILRDFSSPASARAAKGQMTIPAASFVSICGERIVEELSDSAWQLEGFDYTRVLDVVRVGAPNQEQGRLIWAIYNLHRWHRSLRASKDYL